MARIVQAVILALALIPTFAFAGDVANTMCPTPNANQTYASSASCGETVNGKTNLYGCQCSDADVKGSCTAQNVCKGHQCLINGTWQTCKQVSSSGTDTI